MAVLMKNTTSTSDLVSYFLVGLVILIYAYLESRPELNITHAESVTSSAIYDRKEVSRSPVFVFILNENGEEIRISGGKSFDALIRFPMKNGFPVCLRYTKSTHERSGEFVGYSYKLKSYNGGFCNE